MSVTKLKTVGNWQGSGWQAPRDPGPNVRGRVITGLLTSALDLTVVAPKKPEK